MQQLRLIGFLTAGCVLALGASAAETLLVSPAGALPGPKAALERIRAQRNAGAISREDCVRVRLEPGVYQLDGPLVLGSEDSNVSFEGGPGVVLSGGRAVTGWRRLHDGVWRAVLPKDRPFRQLTVNGVRVPRCRHPNEGCFKAAGEEVPFDPKGMEHTAGRGKHSALVYDPKDVDFAALKKPGDVELRVFHWWVDSHLRIKSVDTVSNRVNFVHPASVYVGRHAPGGKPGLYRVENAREFLDAPGEWHYDAGTGYLDYLPRSGEDPSLPSFRAVAARECELVRLEGDPVASGRSVGNVSFRDIVFRDADAKLVGSNNVNGAQGSASIGAAVRLLGARGCRFENCRFEALDGFAADVKGGSRGIVFDHCVFRDIGAGAIRMDGGKFADHPALQTRCNAVRDCEIGPYGLDWASACGILVMNASDNAIIHNHIHDGYYTGVSIGYSWGYGDSVSARNLVAYNHIENIGKGVLNDMGGIYMLGLQPGTVIRNNVIHGIRSWSYGGHCCYADEGTQGVLIEKNLFYDAPDIFNIHYARELTVRNNVIALGGRCLMTGGRYEPHVTAYFHGNIFYYEKGCIRWGSWRNANPYEFAYLAFGEKQPRTDHDVADYNLFWSPTQDREKAEKQYLEKGVNEHSLWADPKFADPGRGDFNLAADSPAFGLGFERIDFSQVGPRE